MTAGSPLGISRRSRSCKTSKRVVAVLADRELDAVALGRVVSMIGRRAGERQREEVGALPGSAGWDGRAVRAWRQWHRRGASTSSAAVETGSFRIEDGTSGRGASSATSASISRRLRPEARARTAS